MRGRMRATFLLAVVMTACGGAVAGIDSPDASTGSTDAGATAPAASVRCPWEQGTMPVKTVPYDKRCATTADCAIGLHLNDCCGQEIAMGVNKGSLALFTRDGGICGDEFGGLCDCATGGIVAEDGRMSKKPKGADIVVACTAGACVTHVAP